MAPRPVRYIAMLLLLAAAHARSAPALGLSPGSPAASHAGIVDARAEFRAVFCGLLRRDRPGGEAGCQAWLRHFPGEAAGAGAAPLDDAAAVNVVIVGGLFSECLPAVPTFGDAVEPLRARGYRVSYAPVRGRSSSEANAAIIAQHIRHEIAAAPRLPLVIVAYSKGVSDTMTALASYPEMGDAVGAVISVAGVVNGSHAADQLRRLYGATGGLLPYRGCPAGDGGEVRSLTHEYRQAWLATHRLPGKPLYFSIIGVPSPDRVSSVFSVFRRKLSRIDPRNDGQMIYADAFLPRSSLLAYANADHFAIALPIERSLPAARLVGINRNAFPRAQLIEAAIRMAQERLARH